MLIAALKFPAFGDLRPTFAVVSQARSHALNMADMPFGYSYKAGMVDTLLGYSRKADMVDTPLGYSRRAGMVDTLLDYSRKAGTACTRSVHTQEKLTQKSAKSVNIYLF